MTKSSFTALDLRGRSQPASASSAVSLPTATEPKALAPKALAPGEAKFLAFMFAIHLRERILHANGAQATVNAGGDARLRFAIDTPDANLERILSDRVPAARIHPELGSPRFRENLRNELAYQLRHFGNGLRLADVSVTDCSERVDATVRLRGDFAPALGPAPARRPFSLPSLLLRFFPTE